MLFYILNKIIEAKPNTIQAILTAVKCSLKTNIPIQRASHALAIEKIRAPLHNHDQFLRANSQNVLQTR